MADIAELPDTSKLEDGKVYLVSGRWLKDIVDILQRLWRGDNIGKGPLIRVRQAGPGGYSIAAARQAPGSAGGAGVSVPWPFKVHNTTVNTVSVHSGQVQINGGDGALASLSPGGVVATVNGNFTNVASGTPPAYPQLAITGNGYVYAYATLDGANVTAVGVGFTEGSIPVPDTNTPPTFGVQLLASISGYAVDGVTGNITFSVDDASGPIGITTVQVCMGTVTFL